VGDNHCRSQSRQGLFYPARNVRCCNSVDVRAVDKQLSGAALNYHPLSRASDQTRGRAREAAGVGAPWGSLAARAAVRRTCHQVTLRCQRVLARYSAGKDELTHVAIGDPDPGPAHQYRACGFQWADEISTSFVLLWRCTREQGHHGQHLAGTGQSIVAVHPGLA
jgi:hypothetical protein